MKIPVWLTLLVATWVVVFGAYRIWVALKRDYDNTTIGHWDQKSMFGRTKRAHLIYGIAYLALGVMLVLSVVGVPMPFLSN